MFGTPTSGYDLRQFGLRLAGILEVHHDHKKLITSVPLGMLTSQLIKKSPRAQEQDAKRDAKRRAQGREPDFYDPNSDSASLHEEIQREFKGPRLKNMFAYMEFLKRGPVLKELTYSLPPINVFVDGGVAVDVRPDDAQPWRPLTANDHGSVGYARIFIDPAAGVAAFDGETQAAAWWELLNDPNLRKDRQLLERAKACPVSVQINFDAPLTWAKRAFFLHNRMGVKVNAALAVSMDTDNPLVTIVDSLIEQLGLQDSVSRTARQGTLDKPLTVFALVQFVQTFQWGLAGLQKANSMRGDQTAEDLHADAFEWAQDLHVALGERLVDRDQVCSTPAGIAALGAVGHRVHEEKNAGRKAMLARIGDINWSKGSHWVGIAGKPTRDGITISGPKEVSSHIFAAIVEPESPGGQAITLQKSA